MNDKHKRWLAGAVIAIAAFAIVLWAWNTLAALFGLPAAQAKHLLAVVILLAAFRVVLAPRAHRTGIGGKRHARPAN